MAYSDALHAPTSDITLAPELLWPPDAARAQQRNAKHQAVLAAAARLFCEQGFHAAALDDVATRLHVSKPTLYYYVRNKRELVKACAEQGCIQALEAISNANIGQPLKDSMKARLKAYARVVATDFGWCMVRLSEFSLADAASMREQVMSALTHSLVESVEGVESQAWMVDAIHGIACHGGRIPAQVIAHNVDAFLDSINFPVGSDLFHVKPQGSQKVSVQKIGNEKSQLKSEAVQQTADQNAVSTPDASMSSIDKSSTKKRDSVPTKKISPRLQTSSELVVEVENKAQLPKPTMRKEADSLSSKLSTLLSPELEQISLF